MSSYPKIILVVRRSQDWFHGVNDYSISGRTGREQFCRALVGWKFFFKMSYLEFRQRLRDIAKRTYVENRFDAIFYWADWGLLRSYPEGTWLFPIDEDDWLSPHLTEVVYRVLEEHSEEKLLRWDIAYTSAMGKTYFNHWDTYPSCSYMARKPFPRSFLWGHWNLIYRGHKWVPYSIPHILATKLHNLSSISFLYHSGETINNVVKVARERRYLQKCDYLSDFMPFVDLYNEALEDLYNSLRS